MNKKKKRTPSLRFAFMATIFSILSVTLLLISPLALLFARHQPFGPSPVMPMLSLLAISVVLGTVISGMVSKILLRPINQISKAMQAVAEGDFTVRLDDTQRVHELRGIYSSFNLMTQELGSIETLRGDFVVNVSHEFKTPLASIEGCATLLQDESATLEERREYAAMIQDATRQLSTLTGNILKLSKLESGGMPLDKSPFRLDEQLRQAVLALEVEWTAKDIEMDVDLDTVRYNGNEELLMQVWQNLLSNAVKFTPKGGLVRVALYTTMGGVSIQVEDNGIGLTKQEQRHIFERFYQADSARKQEGNGLGLALAKRIVEQHGGEITVQSTKGEGSIFTVRLPAAR